LADAEKTVMKSIRSLLKRKKGAPTEIDMNADLYEELNLDSLDAAELSAALEDDLGKDPYSEGQVPRTAAEIVEYYES
jgi:acyl carrier protein